MKSKSVEKQISTIFLTVICSVYLLFTFGISYSSNKYDLEGRIAFTKDGDIYVVNLTTRETRQLTREGIYDFPKFSPDGKWIIVEGKENYFVINKDGAQKIKIPIEPSRLGTFVYWLDNKKILFLPITIEGMGINQYKIVSFVDEIAKIIEEGIISEPHYAHSESIHSFATILETLNQSQKNKEFPVFYFQDEFYIYKKPIYLIYSPKGNYAIAPPQDLRTGPLEPTIFNVLNENKQYFVFFTFGLGSIPCYYGRPCWSPDGEKIAFSQNAGKIGTLIHILDCSKNVFHPELRVLTRLKSHKTNIKGYFLEEYTSPCWSPDGKWIACTHSVPSPFFLPGFFCKTKDYIYIISKDGKIDFSLIEGSNPDWTF